MKSNETPKTLLEVIRYFSDERVAFEYMRDRRWPNGVTCPRCGSDRVHFIDSRMIWRCNGCVKQFSVKVGTIFEDSPIKFSKWLPAMWLIANCKNGISSYELARDLQVTQKTAWFMLHRIRLAMQSGSFDKPLSGEVEADETFIGGKFANMHVSKRAKIRASGTKGRGPVDKMAVMGLLERHGDVRVFVLPSTNVQHIGTQVRAHVMKGSKLYTDNWAAYKTLRHEYDHQWVSHMDEYVRGNVHTNGLENFWSLLKRSIKGTYVSVDPWHLFRYCDEQAFRFNLRKVTDGERFSEVVSKVAGKRLTYNELTGKVLAAEITA